MSGRNWIEAAVRRQVLITNEANAIGTAYLRIDLLPGDTQREMKDLFRGGCPVGNVSGFRRSGRDERKARGGCGPAREYLDQGSDGVPKARGVCPSNHAPAPRIE